MCVCVCVCTGRGGGRGDCLYVCFCFALFVLCCLVSSVLIVFLRFCWFVFVAFLFVRFLVYNTEECLLPCQPCPANILVVTLFLFFSDVVCSSICFLLVLFVLLSSGFVRKLESVRKSFNLFFFFFFLLFFPFFFPFFFLGVVGGGSFGEGGRGDVCKK